MHRKTHFGWPARLLIGLLFCLLSLPAALGFIWDEAASSQKLENRRMANLPTLALFREDPAKYIEALDRYFKDNVGLRRAANELYRKLRYYVLRDPPLPNVSIGQDGFVFMNSHRVEQPNFVFDLLISHGLCLRYNSFGFPEPVTMVLSYFLNRILSNISFQQFQKSLHLLIIDSNI